MVGCAEGQDGRLYCGRGVGGRSDGRLGGAGPGMLRSIVAVVVVAVVAAVGGWWWYTTQSLGNTAAGRPGSGPPGGFAAPVEAAPVRIGTAERQITAVGSLRSNESV